MSYLSKTQQSVTRKSFFQQNLAELTAQAQIAIDEAIELLHAKGITTIGLIDSQMYCEYPDGRKEFLQPLAPKAETITTKTLINATAR